MATRTPTRRTKRKPPGQRRPRAAPHPRTAGRNFNRNRKAIGGKARRLAKRKGAVFGVFSLAVATTAFTLATIGALSEIAAWEFGLATDGIGLGVGLIVGDLRKPPDQSKIKRTVAAAKSRAALCGAPTVDGTPCQNRGRCPWHKGGATKSKTTPNQSQKRPTPKPGPSQPTQHQKPPRQTQRRPASQGVPGSQRSAVNPGHPSSAHPQRMP